MVPPGEKQNSKQQCRDETDSHYDDSRVALSALLLTELSFVTGQTLTTSDLAFSDAAAVAIAAFETTGVVRRNRILRVWMEG